MLKRLVEYSAEGVARALRASSLARLRTPPHRDERDGSSTAVRDEWALRVTVGLRMVHETLGGLRIIESVRVPSAPQLLSEPRAQASGSQHA